MKNAVRLLSKKNIFYVFILYFPFLPLLGEIERKIEIRTIGIPPYGIQTDSDSSGSYFDTANLVAKEAGYQANNYIYPYARIVNELKSGQTDMTIMFKYKELEPYVVYVAPLEALKNVVVGLKGTNFDTFNSLKGKSFAYLRGAKFSDDMDNDPEIYKVITDDFVQGLNMLRAGRVDGIVGPLDPILSAAKKLDFNDDIFGVPFVVSERTPWLQVSKKSLERLSIKKLNQIFLNLKSNNKLKNIRDKYTK